MNHYSQYAWFRLPYFGRCRPSVIKFNTITKLTQRTLRNTTWTTFNFSNVFLLHAVAWMSEVLSELPIISQNKKTSRIDV